MNLTRNEYQPLGTLRPPVLSCPDSANRGALPVALHTCLGLYYLIAMAVIQSTAFFGRFLYYGRVVFRDATVTQTGGGASTRARR